MTLFLASVRNAAEAQIVLRAGADIVDVKEPGQGALGAVSAAELVCITACVDGAATVSATIGDPPLSALEVANGIASVADAGADIAKVALSPSLAELVAIAAQALLGRKIVVVLMADRPFDPAWLGPIRDTGAVGVMLDTADKSVGPLLAHRTGDELAAFVRSARALGLLCGLAGSLRLGDVPDILALNPDFAGFRGALCASGRRILKIDPGACLKVRAAIPRYEPERIATLHALQLAPI